MDVKIIDKDGEWVVHTGLYPFVDPTDGRNTRFEPGLPTKVVKTEWMAKQPLIVKSPDPWGNEPIPGVIKPTDGTVVPKDDETGEPSIKNAAGLREAVKAQAAVANAAKK